MTNKPVCFTHPIMTFSKFYQLKKKKEQFCFGHITAAWKMNIFIDCKEDNYTEEAGECTASSSIDFVSFNKIMLIMRAPSY